MFKRILFPFILLFMMSSLVFSLDDQGNPNDPDTNDRANACFEGGDMEGKCDTLWEWMCGWHVIRLDPQDEDSRAEFPLECVSLLPPLIQREIPVSAPTGLAAGCIDAVIANYSRYWPGGAGPSPSQWYVGSNTCSGVPDSTQIYVAAYSQAEADSLCGIPASPTAWPTTPLLYHCI